MKNGSVTLEFSLIFITLGILSSLFLLDILMLFSDILITSHISVVANQVTRFNRVDNLAAIELGVRNYLTRITGLRECNPRLQINCFRIAAREIRDNNFIGVLEVNLFRRRFILNNLLINREVPILNVNQFQEFNQNFFTLEF